jgi:hypothetical protein
MVRQRSSFAFVLATAALAAGLAPALPAQVGSIGAVQKISPATGGFTGAIADEDEFGHSLAAIGDLDNDGIGDLAVGVPWDDDGGQDRGAVWILFLKADGTVKSHQKISDTAGGFTGSLLEFDWFGWSVAPLGDLDNDGVTDLAVGALQSDDFGGDTGSVWILFLNANGTVKAHQEISNASGSLGHLFIDYTWFGTSVAPLGDFDGDGVEDLAVGAHGESENGIFRGAVYVLFLNSNGTVKGHEKINELHGGFTGDLDDGDEFGWGLANVGDLDGNGSVDLAVSALLDDDGGFDQGAVWVLFLQDTGAIVAGQQKISSTTGGFAGDLDDKDHFGRSISTLGDLDGDGTTDLAVGASQDDDGGTDRGAVYELFLNPDGTVASHLKLSALSGPLQGALDDEDKLGGATAGLGDHDGDGVLDLAAGASQDDDAGFETGAVYVLFLDGGTWVNLGFALAGTAGLPQLAGTGSLLPASAGSLSLTSARPAALSFLFVALAGNPTPFKGGQLVPVPSVMELPFVTSGAGAVTLPFVWPVGLPSGLEVFFQYAIQDAAAIKGVALSNALKGMTP